MPRLHLNAIAWLALAVVLASSMVLKVTRYGLAAPVDLQSAAEARIESFLVGAGFTRAMVTRLSSGGAFRELRFMAPGCTTPVRVVVLTGDASEDALVKKAWAPDSPVYVFQGRSYAEPPGAAVLATRFAAMFGAAAGDRVPAPLPVVAVSDAAGGPCAAPAAAAWPR
jgi:hypothetical protein